MTRVEKPTLAVPDVEAFLAERHGGTVSDVEALEGGFWSSAFAYRFADRQLVARFGSIRSGYDADLAAMAYGGPDLPVPEVLEVGDAFGASYAISVRHHGRFLEDVREDEADTAGPAIVRLLGALKGVPPAPAESWHQRLRNGLVDDEATVNGGWREALRAHPEAERVFLACESRIGALLDACPERRDLIHNDLVHRNVLIAEDASRVNAVFSWKCAGRGDFLYDVAWCTFWGGSFHPGIAVADVFGRVVRAPWAAAHLDDAAVRHHCYELHVGATHLGWNAWIGDDDSLAVVARHTAAILEREPVRLPRPSG
ncbi:MAG TPA: phosphotransferase [Acidimicrobiales bacterium]|nr:phosphotransferase [Acidimicrobiales bacterium]